MALSWAVVKMRIHRHLSWSCKMQNTLLSSEGGPRSLKSTVIAILGEHRTAVTATLTPALSLLCFRDNHPGQFFPPLTHTSTCSLFLHSFFALFSETWGSSVRSGKKHGGCSLSFRLMWLQVNTTCGSPGELERMPWSWQHSPLTPVAVASPAAGIWRPTSLQAPQQALQSQQQARGKTSKHYCSLEASMV